MKLTFCMQINKYGKFLQIDTMILMGMIKHFQSFQNSKFPMFLHMSKKVRDEVVWEFNLQTTIDSFLSKGGKIPSDWKKAHVVPVHKKREKQCLKIIDLLPYFQFAPKFLSVSFIMSYSPFLLKIS